MSEAAARREARRKRILENSESRLRVISGLNKTDNVEVFSEDTFDEGCSPSLKIGEIPQNSEEEKKPDGFSESSNDPLNPAFLRQTGSSHSLISTVFGTQILLIFLAVLVRIILSTCHGYWIGESVFVPIFTLHLLKYCGFSLRLDSRNSGGGIINAVLLLSGLPPQHISRFLQIMGGLKEIMEDFYIYFFSFIIFHVFLELITQ
ncbi:Calcium signal-modulating cyclophilin ligand [Frankliniella fusca]|uniref:Calcium signal-modulating cyclophilin ligand n=1 Tax=Frankliniella fusca TaxID=407009 RepID=A0AAE1GY45_9NEOP|nr:Calcium signal-modulating cyclophilin ligand [Frankliniella fusca]